MRYTIALVLTALLLAIAGIDQAEGFPNGRAAPGNLSAAAQGGCVKLERSAAAAWNTMQLAAGKRLPANGCDSAYRTLAGQQKWRRIWCRLGKCGNAAVPGTSNHGVGRAMDTSPAVRAYIDRHGYRWGWCKRQRGRCGPSDAAHESWHVRWTPRVNWRRRPNPGTDYRNPLLVEGSGGAGQGGWVKRAQRHLHRRLRTGRCHRFPTDGEYGPTTRRCVARFQAGHRIPADGRLGPRTWRALRR